MTAEGNQNLVLVTVMHPVLQCTGCEVVNGRYAGIANRQDVSEAI